MAKEDIEFIAEHFAEAAMDNRYASLPVWNANSTSRRSLTVQAGFAQTRTGSIELSGPLLSAAVTAQMKARWSLTAFAFYDELKLGAAREQRDLQTQFAP